MYLATSWYLHFLCWITDTCSHCVLGLPTNHECSDVSASCSTARCNSALYVFALGFVIALDMLLFDRRSKVVAKDTCRQESQPHRRPLNSVSTEHITSRPIQPQDLVLYQSKEIRSKQLYALSLRSIFHIKSLLQFWMLRVTGFYRRTIYISIILFWRPIVCRHVLHHDTSSSSPLFLFCACPCWTISISLPFLSFNRFCRSGTSFR